MENVIEVSQLRLHMQASRFAAGGFFCGQGDFAAIIGRMVLKEYAFKAIAGVFAPGCREDSPDGAGHWQL
jgi:hypothetical protein